MKLPCIIASDLHLTSNPADAYRWGLFAWLMKQAKREQAKTLLLLGDITDAKDYHSSTLVNCVVDAIDDMRQVFERVVILRGNHDYLRDGHMFFEFLNRLPGVEVITKPTEDIDGELSMFLPFTRTPAKDWAGLDFSHYRYLFLHQTIAGAVASNGQKMDGETLPPLDAGKVYSGDIHVPQIIGGVEYIGSPYHVHFGDRFKARCVVLEKNGNPVDLHFPSPARVMLDVDGDAKHIAEALGTLQAGDQVKVRIALPEADKAQWRVLKATIEELCAATKIELAGVELRVQKEGGRVRPGDRPAAMFDPAEATYRFVDEHGLGAELLDIAMECIE